MQKKYISSAFLGVVLLFSGAGCGNTVVLPNGGMFRSADSGVTWESKSDLLATKGTAGSFISLDVNTFAVDPSDARSLWAGTMANGILYSSDSGDGWTVSKNYAPAELQLTSSRVNSLAVDPANSCVVYATITNPAGASYAIRTINCGRSWGILNTNEIQDRQLGAIAVNPKNRLQLFIGNSVGDIFRSDNGGQSWVLLTRFDNKRIRTIVPHPSKDGVVYVATAQGGLRKTTDGGKTWARVEDSKKYHGAEDVFSIAIDPTKEDALLIGTAYGILHSEDGGASWEAFQLLTAPNETQIISLAVNPLNPAHIYYGTPKAFYRTVDGGQTWTTKRVPTTRVIKQLVVQNLKGVAGAPDQDLVWLAAWQPAQ
jgi:photosystem II stability/assembly factor-like uncharacterized protein